MGILSSLCLEVKENSAKNVAFRDAPAHRNYVAFRDTPMTKAAKCHTFNTSSRRRNCISLAGRFGGTAHVTPMRDVQTGVDEFMWWMVR